MYVFVSFFACAYFIIGLWALKYASKELRFVIITISYFSTTTHVMIR
jgi:hypothetical protein